MKCKESSIRESSVQQISLWSTKKDFSKFLVNNTNNNNNVVVEENLEKNVIIVVGGEEGSERKAFETNSNVLKGKSSYFNAALSYNWTRMQDDKYYFEKPNISPPVFEIILE